MKRVAFHPAILQPLRRAVSAHAVSTDLSCSCSPSASPSSSSTVRPPWTARRFSSTSSRGGGGRRVRNFRLEAIKKEGLAHLDQTAQEASARVAAKPLFVTEEESGPTARQVKEASRIHQVLDEAIDQYSKREATFTIRGDPIMILDVEVSQDLRHARAYWTLPFTLFDLPDETRAAVKRRMQTILEKRGGALQALVHSRLRFYYPPRLRFVQAEDSVLSMAMKDLLR